MHDHNLDDLIIENVEPKYRKTKSLLTIIALLIVVLIVAIIFTKTLLKTPDNSDLAFEEDTTEMIAPELKLKEPANVPEPEKAPSLSTVAESGIKAPADQTDRPEAAIQKEETAPELRLPTAGPEVAEAPAASSKETALSEKDAADIAYWESVQEQRKAAEAAKADAEQKAAKTAARSVQATEPAQPKKTPAPARQKPAAAKPVPAAVSAKRYYIQVGAFKKQPSKQFLAIIKNNGLNYHMTAPNANNLKHLLVGPYNDQASANRALVLVRDRVMKRAFIVVK
ncbi:MAG TPA: SPOR domain-containing protein [Sulfurovum sp.]|uniref:SPOR domain-containing protein n=1 Tax=Sulfurovum sp. TaxID=1969726 RepID=UPI002F944125